MSVSLAARRSSIHTRLADLFCFMVSVYFIVHTCVISMTHVYPIYSFSVNPYLHCLSTLSLVLIYNFNSDSHYYWISSFSVGSFILCYLYLIACFW